MKKSNVAFNNKIQINELYLDPNNYRFVDDSRYSHVEEADIKKESVQRRTRNFIEGEKRENIRDLLDSFKNNGFLNVDVIQVRTIESGGYLVIEGNRRVTALKCLYDDHIAGIDIGMVDTGIFDDIPAEIHEESDFHNRMIIMGLKHISGNKKWAAINQSRMIYDYLGYYEIGTKEYNDNERTLVKSLGISLNKLRNGQRAYHFVRAYQNSDYGEQFTSDKYSFFEEAMRRPSIKNWLGWSEDTYKCENKINQERFFTWISRVEETPETDIDTIENGSDSENYEEERLVEPIITKSVEIRELASFIEDDEKVRLMEERRSIYAVLSETSVSSRISIDNAVKTAADNINMIMRYMDVLEDEDYSELLRIHSQVEKIIPSDNILGQTKINYEVKYNIDNIKHFGQVFIRDYKKFHNVLLDKLTRINILVGPNNSGKTTILEAIYLLCHQNDTNGLLALSEMRLKGDGITTDYINSLIDYRIGIDGVFNDNKVTLDISNYQDSEVEKKDDYLSSIKFSGVISETHSDENCDLTMHMYEKNPIEKVYSRIVHLCRIGYSSPYYHRKAAITELYDDAVRVKIKGQTVLETIIAFIRENIDASINNIILGKDGRFIVDSSRFNEKNVELLSYGEGVDRIFQISLYISFCRNGVLLIDEIETAIHFSLLKRITHFIQELSVIFNTQVFLTTHSKECVDAFVENDYRNEDLMFYQLNEDDFTIKEIAGENLNRLLDRFDTDIRGIHK